MTLCLGNRITTTLSFTTIALCLQSGFVNSEETTVDWEKYMRNPAAISAISAAVTMASPCSKPIVFEEMTNEGGLTLSIHCRGNEDDEFSVFLNFLVFDDQILPGGFELAG